MEHIGFNKPFLSGNELSYIQQAVFSKKLSGNGQYTSACHEFFKESYNFKNCLLTTSCTDALEMAALLLNIQPGDEVIMPSFTFVSTANAFVLRGAKIVFVDSRNDHPGMNEGLIEKLISPKTKAIVVVHYAGVACDMDKVTEIAEKHNLYVIEDAAQAIDSFYKGRPLGSIGHLAAFSFHETKNIISGEGGMLVINEERFAKRAEIIWEKGTNRSAFWRGEVDKYGWVDQGSSFLPSEIIAAFLLAQLENLKRIQDRRLEIWKNYDHSLRPVAGEHGFSVPHIPDYATNNAHMYYLICDSGTHRNKLIEKLRDKGINAVFHYQSLHSSPYYTQKHDGRKLPHSDRYSECLVRLPFYFELTETQIEYIVNSILLPK